MSLFTIKYTPQNSDQVFGQAEGVAQLKDFIVNYKQKKHKAALLIGPLGNGKTSSVYAIAKELNYDLLEINSSDLRNEEAMKTFLGSATGQQSLFFTPKLILIDEIDNISGRNDRGCIPALLSIMEKSAFPLILTANELEDSRYKPLKKACQIIEYHKLPHKTVAHALRWVAEQEDILYEEKAVSSLARQADGDLRSALIDFQTCSLDKQVVMDAILALSERKRTDTILNALQVIFKSSTAGNARSALENVDMDAKDVLTWIDENVSKEYLDALSLAKAYEHLSRADVFQGRISRQQHWRLLIYINDLLTAGISSAKEKKNPGFVPYSRTMRFLRMWQAKMKWAKKKDIASKLASKTHTSFKVAYEQVPYLQKFVSSKIADELELSEEEIEWLGK